MYPGPTVPAQKQDTSKSDAPLYLLFGISTYVQGKSFIAHICVSPHLPKVGIQMIVIDKVRRATRARLPNTAPPPLLVEPVHLIC